MKGDAANFKAWVDSPENPPDINQSISQENNICPVHVATSSKKHEILAYILSRPGINVNKLDLLGRTACHYACGIGNLDGLVL